MMKSVFAFLATGLAALAIAPTANAMDYLMPESGDGASAAVLDETNPVEIPASISTFDLAWELAQEFRAVQIAQISWLETQIKFYELIRLSFEGSRGLTEVLENEDGTANETVAGEVVSTGALVYLDYRLAKLWFSGAAPTAALVKSLWGASGNGNVGVVRATAAKTWKSLVAMGRKIRAPKSFVTTAALGTFAYIQYETFFVIQMSQEQFDANVQALNAKIASLKLQKSEIANQFNPALVPAAAN